MNIYGSMRLASLIFCLMGILGVQFVLQACPTLDGCCEKFPQGLFKKDSNGFYEIELSSCTEIKNLNVFNFEETECLVKEESFYLILNDFKSPEAAELLNSLLEKSKGLKKLNMNCCDIDSAPEKLSACCDLEELNLAGNNFSSPEAFKKLDGIFEKCIHLKTLNLGACDLKLIPKNLKYCTELEELRLESNDLNTPEAIESLNELLENVKHLKKLNIESCGLICCPENLKYCTELEELWLAGCHLGSPAAIDSCNKVLENCKNLKILDLNETNLTVLPENLKNCSKLEYLDLACNDFSSKESFDALDAALEGLKGNLRFLELYDCKLNSIPNNLRVCLKLESLSIWGDDFSKFVRIIEQVESEHIKILSR